MFPEQQQQEFPHCEFLIIVTTQNEKRKLEATAKTLGLSWRRILKETRGNIYEIGGFDSFRVLVVRLEDGVMGPFFFGGSASKAIYYQRATHAQSVILVGMAFGRSREHQKLGDVLVSQSIFPYDMKAVIEDPNQQAGYRYDYSDPAKSLTQRYYPANETLVRMAQKTLEEKEFEFDLWFGSLLSGGSIISSFTYLKKILDSIPASDDPVVGGEMEGVGLLSLSQIDSPLWLIVKGISDFADEERGEEIQQGSREKACENASLFLLKTLLYESAQRQEKHHEFPG